MHLPFLNFIFDDRQYNLTACQKSFELPWHELLSPVLLNINHYHRCLFCLACLWCEQSNLGFVQTRFSRSNLTEKMEMFYFFDGSRRERTVCLCCFDENFAGFRWQTTTSGRSFQGQKFKIATCTVLNDIFMNDSGTYLQ